MVSSVRHKKSLSLPYISYDNISLIFQIMFVKFLVLMVMIEVFSLVDGKSCNGQAKEFRKKSGKAGTKSEK